MAATPKCDCGCGQAPARSTRLRKAACPWCGYIVRLSRDCISRGLPSCPCGGTLTPNCLHDQCAVPGELGDAAYSALRAMETDSAVRSDNYKRRALGQHRCPSCATFRTFGASCDPTHIEPCPKCGSLEPARFKPRSRETLEPAMPF